jgi:hypothetical protein
VPPIWEDSKDFFKSKKPFWNHAETRLFIAYKDGVPVGRIGGFIDQLFIKNEKEKVGLFGFFEVINDYEVASGLFDLVKNWMKSKGMEKMWGPIDGRIDVGSGLLLNGFNETPYIFDSYTPKYYVDLVEKYKMKKFKDLYTYYIDFSKPIPEYLKAAADKVEKAGIKIRKFNRIRAGKELKWWIPLMLKSFSNHWGYIDAPEEEVLTRFGVKQARWIVDSDLFLVAEDPNGKPIGFKWNTPDYNQAIKKLNGKLGIIGYLKFFYYMQKVNKGRLNIVGVDEKWRNKKIGSAFNYHTIVEMKNKGYPGAECGWYDEANIASINTIEKTGAKRTKTYRVYQSDL